MPDVRSSTDCTAAGRCCAAAAGLLLCRRRHGGRRAPTRKQQRTDEKGRLFQHDHSWRVVILRCAAESALSSFGVLRPGAAVRRHRRRRCGPARPCASASPPFASPPSSRPCRTWLYRSRSSPSPYRSLFAPARLGRLRLAGFRLGFHRCHIFGRRTRSGACLGADRRFLRAAFVFSRLRAVGRVFRFEARQLVFLDRLPRVLRSGRALLPQLARGIVLRQPAALRVHPGIHFVLPAHIRNLSNAPTPPTSASSDASSMNLMRAAV